MRIEGIEEISGGGGVLWVLGLINEPMKQSTWPPLYSKTPLNRPFLKIGVCLFIVGYTEPRLAQLKSLSN